MKISHNNVKEILKWLEKENLEISFDIDFILKTYKEVFLQKFAVSKSTSLESRYRAAKTQIWFIALNLLIVQHIKNNSSARNIKEGFVYAITNPAWPGYVKIGSAFNAFDRLKSYQTSSPFRDFKMVRSIFVGDRIAYEKSLHTKFNCDNEWAKIDLQEVLTEFKIIEHQFDDKIYEFCSKEILNFLRHSPKIFEKKSNKNKLLQSWLLTKHIIAKHKTKEKIEKISLFLEKRDSWQLVMKDNEKIAYKSKKFNLEGLIFKDKVVINVL